MTVTINGSSGITAPEVILDNTTADGGQVVLKSSGYSNWNLDNYSGRLRAYYSSTEYFTVTNSGNVGIGTSSPATKLNIGSGGVFRLNRTDNGTYGDISYVAGTGFLLNDANSDGYTYQQGGTTKLRIDSSGSLLVGTTSSISGPGAARITAKSESTGWFAAAFEGYYGVGINAPVAGDNSFLYFYYRGNGSPVGRVYTNGTTTTYGTTSDYRLKEDVAPMVGAIEKVMQLKPCTYVWKSTQEASCGFIAHELQEVIPEAVAGEKDDVFENGQIKPQMVDAGSSSLIATLTAAIQELKAIVDEQSAKITALENK